MNKILADIIGKMGSCISLNNKQSGSANGSFTSSVGATTLLILAMISFSWLASLFNLFGLASDVYADSITMTVSTDNISLNLAPNSADGTFVKSSSANISVSTTNSFGYTLGIVANNSQNLVGNDAASGNIFESISSPVAENTFSSGSAYINKWGYTPSQYISDGSVIDNTGNNAVFLPGPNVAGDILDMTDEGNLVANDYTIAIGAKADLATVPGTYSNTFVITAVANMRLAVSYEANNAYTEDFYFGNNSANITNTVYYDATSEKAAIEEYLHTPNISDAGVQNGTFTGESGYTFSKGITASGASKLHLRAEFGSAGGSGTGMFFMAHDENSTSSPITSCGDVTANVLGVAFRNSSGANIMMECDIEGNSLYMVFGSSSSIVDGYGLYAAVSYMGDVYNKTLMTGTYNIPTVPSGVNFMGWSESDNATAATYTSESDISTRMPYTNIDPAVTLYPVYTANVTIRTSAGVSDVMLKDGDNTVCATNSTSGTTCILPLGKTYTLSTNVSAGYVFDSWIISGAGSINDTTVNNTTFEVGVGSTTIVAEANTLPKTYMQDVSAATLATLMPNVGDETTLYDNRDEKPYTVAHMADGKYWMNQNLDLCIGCTGVATLTSENTNLNVSGSGAYSDGYASSDGVITWTPASTAVTSSHTISGTTVDPAFPRDDYVTPYSAEGGDVYVYTSGDDSGDTTFNSLFDCEINGGHTEAECAHYHVGDYYNWSAAIASNDSSALGSVPYENASNDICPAGWRLPRGTAGDSNDTASTREFGELFYRSGIVDGLTTVAYTTNGFINLRTLPLYFVRGGAISGDTLSGRGGGVTVVYYSSTVSDSTMSYAVLLYGKSVISSATSMSRWGGLNIRCVAQ